MEGDFERLEYSARRYLDPMPGLLLFLALLARPTRSVEPLTIFNAGSLAYPIRELLTAFNRQHPEVRATQESSGSLEAARKLTELGKIPDILAVADYGVIAKLLVPTYTSWYIGFASNAMVLAFSDRSISASEISADNWWRVLLRKEVRWGLSDANLDPNGYRAHMVFQLAETAQHEPGLAARLERAVDPRYVRPSEAQLLGLVQAGELDYAWSYRSLAATAGLRWLNLPAAIDLSDPTRAAEYAKAHIRLPGPRMGSADSVEFRGEAILYAVTIPRAAAHPGVAREFVRFILSSEGQAILQRAGFKLLPKPVVSGTPPFAIVPR